MGLDVYMYHYKDFEKSKQVEKEYEEYSEKLWADLEEIDPDPIEKAKDHVRQKLDVKAQELGLDKYGCDITNKTRIEDNSVLHPEHYFKIGYFRSSYNDGGINNVLRNLDIPDLYAIFNPGEEYEFSPDWENALEVVKESIELMKKDQGFRVEAISANMFEPDNVPKDGATALKIFNDQLVKHSDQKGFNSYSNRDGHFYMKEALEIHGAIPGKDFMGRPCTYLVYKDTEASKHYLESLEIVQETIEFVLKQKDPQAYYLSWSG